MGAPTFAYEVASETETFIIDRQGLISNSKGEAVALETILNPIKQAEAEIITSYDELADGFEIEFLLNGHTGISLRNIVNMIASKQRLIMKVFKTTQEFVDGSFAEILNQQEVDTIEQFKDAYLRCRPERCPGLVFDFAAENLVVKLDAHNFDKAKIDAFYNLTMLINEKAKTLKHTTFKPAQDDNPKYALRTWLIRLGMNGEVFKADRKALLEGLDGSSAFRKPNEVKSMKDRFFTQKFCDRCGMSLEKGRIMSMLNTDCICLACKKKEMQQEDYVEAVKADQEEIRKGNYNYKGIEG